MIFRLFITEAPPKSLLLAQSEVYVEYARDGKIIKGVEKPVILSKYEEDVYVNNHTSVFGSYWSKGEWGYKCCHSFIKNSYCVGNTGKSDEQVPITTTVDAENEEKSDSEKEESEEKVESIKSSSESESSSDENKSNKKSKNSKKDKKKNKKKKLKEKRREKKKRKKSVDKLEEALQAEDEHNKRVDQLMSIDERKRPYNSMYEVKAPTEEELEAFMIKRAREEDPMLQFMSKK